MKENIKLGLILLIVTAISGLCLGLAYTVTKEPIERQMEITAQKSMKETLSAADRFEKSDTAVPDGSIVKEANTGYSGDKLVGYAVKVAPKGFKGIIEIMVGITADGKVSGIKILSHTESPGLGANATREEFSGQFRDKPMDNPFEVVKNGAASDNQIDTITGATITSKAVVSGVNEAINFYGTALKGGTR